jgi:hypothetical protein
VPTNRKEPDSDQGSIEFPGDPLAFRHPSSRPYDVGRTREQIRTVIVLTSVGSTVVYHLVLALLVLTGVVSPTKARTATFVMAPVSALTVLAAGFYFKGWDRTM